MLSFIKSLFRKESDSKFDGDLVQRILENLKREPSDQLRSMFDPPMVDNLSVEALEAARLLLERRAKNLEPEPVYRIKSRTEREQEAWEQQAVAPGFDRRLLSLDVGSRVYWERSGQTGTIIRWHDEKEIFYIRYDNGDGEWTDLRGFPSADLN